MNGPTVIIAKMAFMTHCEPAIAEHRVLSERNAPIEDTNCVRRQIPRTIEQEVLFRNQSVCCICQKSGVQIHHLDGNPSNNTINNLCVLCVAHHAEASSKSNIVKALSQSLLRKYKAQWEGLVANRRRSSAQLRLQRSSKVESDLARFEIKRTVYGLHQSRSVAELNAAVDYLYNWHLLEGRQADIIDAISSVHWLLNEREILVLAKRLHEFFWQYIDPKKIPMTEKEARIMISAVELLQFMGIQSAIIDQSFQGIREIIKSIEWFNDVARSYRRPRICSATIKALREIEKECAAWTSQAPKAMKASIQLINRKLQKLSKR